MRPVPSDPQGLVALLYLSRYHLLLKASVGKTLRQPVFPPESARFSINAGQAGNVVKRLDTGAIRVSRRMSRVAVGQLPTPCCNAVSQSPPAAKRCLSSPCGNRHITLDRTVNGNRSDRY